LATKIVLIPEGQVEEHRQELQQAIDRMPIEIRIFPEALRAEAEKEYPGEEYLNAMWKYIHDHPELELQIFEP
jgi:hypothetical protein